MAKAKKKAGKKPNPNNPGSYTQGVLRQSLVKRRPNRITMQREKLSKSYQKRAEQLAREETPGVIKLAYFLVADRMKDLKGNPISF